MANPTVIKLQDGNVKRAKLFKIDMEFFQDKPEARIWKLFKIKQRH